MAWMTGIVAFMKPETWRSAILTMSRAQLLGEDTVDIVGHFDDDVTRVATWRAFIPNLTCWSPIIVSARNVTRRRPNLFLCGFKKPAMTVEAAVVALVSRITSKRDVDPVAAAILAAAHLDICHDSHQFARTFGIAHAIVIRACNMLADELSLYLSRQTSQRLRYHLTPNALDLFEV